MKADNDNTQPVEARLAEMWRHIPDEILRDVRRMPPLPAPPRAELLALAWVLRTQPLVIRPIRREPTP
jgi:hypothetical protein